MRYFVLIFCVFTVSACGEEPAEDDKVQRFIEAIGLGGESVGSNGLGAESTPNGLGDQPSAETGGPSLGTVSPGNGGLNGPVGQGSATCGAACTHLIDCGLGGSTADCTEGCRSADGDGSPIVLCVLAAGCEQISDCIPSEDAQPGRSARETQAPERN